TSYWYLQNPKVRGYTAPSNKYFGTRARLAYHPAAKQFAGYGIVGAAQVQTYSAPPPPPPPPQQTSSHSQQSGSQKSKKQTLEEYEQNYLARLEQDRQAAEMASQAAAAAKASQDSTRGSMPQGWKP
ncbi:MAG: trans-sialidase, partial [Nitrosopumilaceae archaeon]